MTDQPYLPASGMAPDVGPIPKSAVMVLAADGGTTETFPDMKALKEADLPAGSYELWRFGGTFTVEALPARVRTRFQSAHSKPRGEKSPRKPKRKPKGGDNGSAA